MTKILYTVIEWITRAHEKILRLNDAHELYFNDKQLHFLIIGLLGMGLIFALHPLFTWLAKRDHVIVISWMYVFTVILVVTFAIEIGQRISGNGTMEFSDIQFGIAGFLIMFTVFVVIRGIVKLLIDAIKDR